MLRRALKIRAISGSKNTCRYPLIRGEILCIPCLLCENIARRLRRTTQTLCGTLRLCVRRKICPFVLMAKKYFTQNSQKYTEFAPQVYLYFCVIL